MISPIRCAYFYKKVENYIPGHEGDHPEADEYACPGSQQDEPEPQEYVDLSRKKGSQIYVTENPVRYEKYRNMYIQKTRGGYYRI
jgi:hypothetical protein